MLARIRSHLSYSNVVATIALFVALGGGAYATTQINGKLIKKNSVPGDRINKQTFVAKAKFATSAAQADNAAQAANAVNATNAGHASSADNAAHATSADSATSATSADSAKNADHAGTADTAAPTGAAGGDLTGTYPKPTLGSGKVGTANLADGAVTNAKLATDAVTGNNVLAGSLTGGNLANNTVTTDKVGQGFLTQAGGSRSLKFYAHEWLTSTTVGNDIAFGRVTLQPLASNQFKVCFNFIGSWGYGISINDGALAIRTPASTCGPTETLTTGGSFHIVDGQDVIFGSGDASTGGYFFVYGFYSP